MFKIFTVLGICLYFYCVNPSSYYLWNHKNRSVSDRSHHIGSSAGIFAIDCGITVATIMKFNERLKRMNEIAQKIHHLSDEVGENIYENVTEALEKKEKFEEEHERADRKVWQKKKISD